MTLTHVNKKFLTQEARVMDSKPLGMGGKIGATAIIWGLATGMLAICIPLVSMTKSGVILPMAVILSRWKSLDLMRCLWHASRTLQDLVSFDTKNLRQLIRKPYKKGRKMLLLLTGGDINSINDLI
jgi:hypothetical protein